eukprot:3582640-Amphidinium_carterae.1
MKGTTLATDSSMSSTSSSSSATPQGGSHHKSEPSSFRMEEGVDLSITTYDMQLPQSLAVIVLSAVRLLFVFSVFGSHV